MHYRLCKNVVVKFEENHIFVLKGIWKPVPFDINKRDYKTYWKKINDLFHCLNNNQSVWIKDDDENDLIKLFSRLETINLLYIPVDPLKINHLVCSKQTYAFITPNAKNYPLLVQTNFIDLDEFENYDLKDLDHFLIICNGCSLLRIRKINEKLVKEQKKFYLIILKRNFLHIFFHNSDNSPCFECYYETLINQTENENYFEFLKLKDINETEQNTDEQNVKFNYAIAYFYLLFVSNRYFEDQKTNHKLLSFYFPTLEMNSVNLWKKDDCAVCGERFIKKQKSSI